MEDAIAVTTLSTRRKLEKHINRKLKEDEKIHEHPEINKVVHPIMRRILGWEDDFGMNPFLPGKRILSSPTMPTYDASMATTAPVGSINVNGNIVGTAAPASTYDAAMKTVT
jgi:hypothetical protein